ncbi:hypothetical protein ACVVIH_20650 [Chryseobacterium arthrosphaerae]|uniref:hypothetical protein n=1 Tax=Chryseobacterium arthrosphaerae TaxID=651561 RepID=UPI003D328382
MLDNITPKKNIHEELVQIQFHAEISLNDDVNMVIDWSNEALVFLARTAKLMADSQYHKDRKMRSELTEQIKTIVTFSPSTANKFVDSLMEEENYLFKWAERLNAALSRQIDFARTLISKAKEELKYNHT